MNLFYCIYKYRNEKKREREQSFSARLQLNKKHMFK